MWRIVCWYVFLGRFWESGADTGIQVGNATVGVNTVMWNIDWKAGDVIVACKSLTGLRARELII